jgi:hypothetical protein
MSFNKQNIDICIKLYISFVTKISKQKQIRSKAKLCNQDMGLITRNQAEELKRLNYIQQEGRFCSF